MDLTYKLIFFSIAPVKFPHLQGVKNLICYWFICYVIIYLFFNCYLLKVELACGYCCPIRAVTLFIISGAKV